MKSLYIDNLFSASHTNIIEEDATLQNLILLLSTTKGELVSDPYFGTNLKKYLFDQKGTILRDLVMDDIYEAIRLFMPQLVVKRSNIVVKESAKGEISVSIKAINRLNFKTDLYNIVLLEAQV